MGAAGSTANQPTGNAGGSSTSNPILPDGGPAASCDVVALFQGSCSGMGCHEAAMPAAMLDLVSEGVEARLIDVTSNSCSGWKLVTAGSPEQSLLYQKVALDMPQCGLRMPVAMPLSDSEVQCIKQWIVDLAGGDPPPQCETCGTTACIDLQTDPTHCGDCATSCNGQVCVAGLCQGCQDGEVACGTECVDTQTDSQHCGACDHACGGGETCVAGACDCSASAAVSFADEVMPIFEATCATMGCHAGRRPQESLDLTASEAYAALVGVNSTQCDPAIPLVAPGNSSGSYLMNKLLGQDMCTGTLMPKGAQSLTQSQIDTIGAWICSGAPNN